MSARKPKNDKPQDANMAEIEELLSGTGSDSSVLLCSITPRPIHELLIVVCGLGGMCSFWYDGNNDRVCFSVRIGTIHKSYSAETAQAFEQTAEALTNKLVLGFAKLGKPNPLKPIPPKAK